MNKESELPTISEITDDTVYLERVYYHGVYVLLHFNN